MTEPRQYLKVTTDQIKEKIKEVKENDFFGVMVSDLVFYLSYEDAMSLGYLKPETIKEEWTTRAIISPLQQIKEYLPFAWNKANNCKGLSAARSLNHINIWLWLAGYSDLEKDYFDNYEYYGKPQLVLASALVNFDWREHDNGCWVNDEYSPSISLQKIDEIAKKYEIIATDGDKS